FCLNSGCILPNHPEFGKWFVTGSKSLQPGMSVARGTRLNVQCHEHFKLDSQRVINCGKNKWSRKLGRCLKLCPSIVSTPRMRVTCTYKGKERENCTEAVEGTRARFQCANFYDVQLKSKRVHVCTNGMWDQPNPQCVPVCGQKPTTNLTINGYSSDNRDAPWHVSIYHEDLETGMKDYIFSCVGSLLSERIILTAAHCVTDDKQNLKSKKHYIVAVGNEHQYFNVSADTKVQFSQVHEMFIPREFNIVTTAGDIAILVTEKTFVLSESVLPVCLDTSQNHKLTENQTVDISCFWQNSLLTESAHHVSHSKCQSCLHKDFQYSFTPQHQCVTIFNNGIVSLCYSGMGIVYKHDDKYYVTGVAIKHMICDGFSSKALMSYVDISNYMSAFILSKLSIYETMYIVHYCLRYVFYNFVFAFLLVSHVKLNLLVNSFTYGAYDYTNYIRVRRSNSCTLPQHPQFGRWTIYGASTQLSPGKSVPERTILEIRCNKNYIPDGDDSTTCKRGTWTHQIAQCLQTCPTISNTLAMTVTCSRNLQTLKSCANVFDNTMARFHCARYFEFQTPEDEPARLCSNGSWVGSLPTCVPICGQPSPVVDPTLIVGGTEAERGKYPWQIALYDAKSKILLCGGTLLNQRVVLTAAHCITDGKAQLAPKENYIVAAGKYFLRYDHPDDVKSTQFSSVLEMFIPVKYRGHARQYADDIAIIITTQIFDLSINVRPICVIWETSRYIELLDPTNTTRAYVSGWGYTREFTGRPDVLKELEVPLISDQQCIEGLPEDDTEYVTGDKFCAGFLNSSTSVCKGDSGGGLVAKRDKRYYIIGIVSLSPRGNTQTGGCNSQLYTLYTNFSSHINFVLEKEAKFRPDIGLTTDALPTTRQAVTNLSNGSNCILPIPPQFGKWRIVGAEILKPGMFVATKTIIHVQCDEHFKLEGPQTMICRNGRWSQEAGRCLKVCPPIISTPIMRVTCTYNGKERENCTEAVDGTSAKIQCADFYEDLQLENEPDHICFDGTWSRPHPQCVPACGLWPTRNFAQSSDSNKYYPWHVFIYAYNKEQRNNQLICSGSLISETMILSALICFRDPKSDFHFQKNYTVAAGKSYKVFNDVRDTEAQFSEVIKMYLFRNFSPLGLGGAAFLVIEKPFVLSRNVLPICFDEYQDHNPIENQTLYISSWNFQNRNSIDTSNEQPTRFLSHSTCRSCTKILFHPFLTKHRSCVSCSNSGDKCRYEIGSSFAYKYKNRYYVSGVADSLAGKHLTGIHKCRTEFITFYFDVSNYMRNLTKFPKSKSYYGGN
ncbi:uncharacterized protein LOC135133831, partial [Zophobas morio]|uniref:uncharacterized protein LOC135133831 n=1 Tax=Zophobas morio TaxID=2755281 RepID=UPI0030833C40